MASTQEKKAVSRNHPRESTGIRLIGQGFKSAILNTIKEITEIMSNEVKYENSVSPNREHQQREKLFLKNK